MRGVKLCPECGCPMLPKGRKRKNPHEYRHANGCPNDDYRKNKGGRRGA